MSVCATMSASDLLCTHAYANLSADSSVQHYVVIESSLFSWHGVTLCSFFFAALSLSLKRHYHYPLYLPASFPSMGTCLAVRAPWLLQGPVRLSRVHTYNHSTSHITKYLLEWPWTKCWSLAVLGYMCVVALVCCIQKSFPLYLRWPIHT